MTTPLVSNSAVMSVRRIGAEAAVMLALRPADDLGRTQQFGADRQMARLCRAHIYLQSDTIAPVDQPDHDTRLVVPVGIAHRQDTLALEGREYLGKVSNLAACDIEDIAVMEIRDIVVALDHQRSLRHCFTAHDGIDLGAEGIFAENSDDEGLAGSRERILWPFDKLGEVEQKDRFDTVFRRW